MVKVLTQMDYVVDVIDFNCKDFKSDKVYDLFIGHAGVNWEQLSRNVVGDAIKIYFSTGTYWKEHNRREAQRFDNFERRRGARLPFDRWIKVSEEFACHDADGIICLGNKNVTKSYAAFPVCFNLNNGVHSDDRYDRTKKDFESGRRHLLYFGSAGNIHKGLDLLVEAFMQLDAHLWCTGKVDSAFYRVYSDELARHPNIHFVNDNKSVDLRSSLFYELMDRCNCVILPSCAEGSPGGVIECMNQGLIPIVSRGANVDVGDFGIMLETDSVDRIVHVVRDVMAKPAQWHRQRSIATRQTVLRDFSEEVFCRNLQRAIEGVVRQTPQVRIMREKVASQAQDNPAEYLKKYADNLGALLRGSAHLKSHDREDAAAQLLQRAAAVDPSCATAICRLGLYYAKRAQTARAEKLVERAWELCPGDKRCLAILQKIRQTPRSVHKLRLEEKRGTKKHAFV
jgi:glycosyltransferase involved in cell wall biosynthesis